MPTRHLPKANSSFINRLNKAKVLDLIRKRTTISRAQIVEESGLSAPTVTRIVEGLIRDEGLVQEAGTRSSGGGRPPILIQLRNDTNGVIGIDLGTTAISGVLADLSAGVHAEIKTSTPVEEGFGKVMDSVATVVDRLLDTVPARKRRIHGVGIAVAGLVNSMSEVVEFSPDFDWKNTDIHQVLNGRVDLPVIFDNVTRVMAIGELWCGRGSEYRDFACVNVGYGIGAGIVTDGQPFGGSEGLAGEFGHITLDKDSPIQCKCGNHGCLEALASGRGIALAAQRALESGRVSTLRSQCDGDLSRITAKMVSEAAGADDELANEIFTGAAEYIGIGIATLVNLFNPRVVFIGGGVAQSGDLLFNTVRKVVAERVMPRHARTVEILPVTHGLNAAVMGAASLILDRVVNLELDPAVPAHAAR